MANKIQVKRGAVASLPTLSSGEPAFTTDTYDLYVGDGVTNHKINSDENFTSTLKTKLDGIEAFADVTDFTNVAAALAAATSAIDVNSQKITSVATPTAATDAVNKSYADALISGLDIKESVRLTTSGALAACTAAGSGVGKTLTGDANGALTVDGVSVVANDRILVKNQATGSDNGIYVVTTVGDGSNAFVLTRATDADENDEVTAGMFCFTEEGSANSDKGYVLTTNDPITVDTTSLSFTSFASTTSTSSWTGLTDTPGIITADYIVKGDAGGGSLEMVSFATTYLDNTAGGTSGETGKAPTSSVMYDHATADTGVHGAGSNTLLNSGSTIDGGTW